MLEWKHKEAYCLMIYSSREGSETEILWNSRDGVTPFIIHSRGGTEMTHIAWKADICAPEFVPPVGMRIFVDATLEDCLENTQRIVQLHWVNGRTPMKDHPVLGPLGREGATLQLAKEFLEDNPGAPKVLEVTEQYANERGWSMKSMEMEKRR